MTDQAARQQLKALVGWLATVHVTGTSKPVLTDSKGVPKVALDQTWTVGPPVQVTSTVFVAIATQMVTLLPADFTQRIINARDS